MYVENMVAQTCNHLVQRSKIYNRPDRTMLDENLRTLGRRTNDMEIELADKKDTIMTLERANAQTKAELDSIYDEQTQIRVELEQQMRQRLDDKDKYLRQVKEDASHKQHRTENEIEMIKI